MVVELTSGNFDEIVGKEKYVVVKFYTKWCRYCRIMAPEYEKLYEDYHKVLDERYRMTMTLAEEAARLTYV